MRKIKRREYENKIWCNEPLNFSKDCQIGKFAGIFLLVVGLMVNFCVNIYTFSVTTLITGTNFMRL